MIPVPGRATAVAGRRHRFLTVDRFGDGSGCVRGSPSARLARTIDEHVRVVGRAAAEQRSECQRSPHGSSGQRRSLDVLVLETARPWELGTAPVTRRSRARDGASMGARGSAGHETFSCIRRHVELTPRPALLPCLRSHVSSPWSHAKRASVSSVASVTSFLKVSSQTKRADGGEGSN